MLDQNRVLVTPRLTMTPFDGRDFDDCVVMRSDPKVTRFVGGVSSREDIWTRILRYAGLWSLLGYGYWAARETASGRFVGEIGFADYRRDTVPDFSGTPEAGWVTAAWAHGQGFAAEAVGAMLAWADQRPEFDRSLAMISLDNLPSLRLAQKFGYARFADTSYKTHPVTLFERRRQT